MPKHIKPVFSQIATDLLCLQVPRSPDLANFVVTMTMTIDDRLNRLPLAHACRVNMYMHLHRNDFIIDCCGCMHSGFFSTMELCQLIKLSYNLRNGLFATNNYVHSQVSYRPLWLQTFFPSLISSHNLSLVKINKF